MTPMLLYLREEVSNRRNYVLHIDVIAIDRGHYYVYADEWNTFYEVKAARRSVHGYRCSCGARICDHIMLARHIDRKMWGELDIHRKDVRRKTKTCQRCGEVANGYLLMPGGMEKLCNSCRPAYEDNINRYLGRTAWLAMT